MYILSLDTTAKTVSVCVSQKKDDGSLVPLSRNTRNCGFTHSETLLPMINDCLGGAGIKISQIGLLACSAGPGSFTGVRIGVSTIKGLSFSLDNMEIPHTCVGVSGLEALATNLISVTGALICPVMDARRSQFYNAVFKATRAGRLRRLCHDRMPTAEQLYSELSEKYKGKKILLTGDGAPLCKKLFDELSGEGCNFSYSVCDISLMYQDAFSVAKVAIDKEGISGKELSPTYLRASQAERERLEREKGK